jgi:hypothetical protein
MRSYQRFGGQILTVDIRARECPYPPPLVILEIELKPHIGFTCSPTRDSAARF